MAEIPFPTDLTRKHIHCRSITTIATATVGSTDGIITTLPALRVHHRTRLTTPIHHIIKIPHITQALSIDLHPVVALYFIEYNIVAGHAHSI